MTGEWYNWTVNYWLGGFNTRGLPGGGVQVVQMLAQKKALEDTGDVRCALNDLDIRKATSHADLIDRQIAAQAVFDRWGCSPQPGGTSAIKAF